MTDNYQYVKNHVRMVPDFPKKGILFLDITTATKDAKSMNIMINLRMRKLIMLPGLNQEVLYLVRRSRAN